MRQTPFDLLAPEYDRWFEAHRFAYQSEVEAVRRFIPSRGVGVEVGVGTGRFSEPFNICIGVEPSERMAAIARSRGIDVHISTAEKLPFGSEDFDFVLMVTTLCFVENPMLAVQEAARVLKPNGHLIIAIIDKESDLGKKYEAMKASDRFYKSAKFFSSQEIMGLLMSSGFSDIKSFQTIFFDPETMIAPDIVKEGHGEGAFVVLKGVKT